MWRAAPRLRIRLPVAPQTVGRLPPEYVSARVSRLSYAIEATLTTAQVLVARGEEEAQRRRYD